MDHFIQRALLLKEMWIRISVTRKNRQMPIKVAQK